MTTVTAIMRQRNGERPANYFMFYRPSPAADEEMQPIDGGLVAFDPDRPIEWEDVMNEQR